MISPELLRHYPFFGRLDDARLRDIAMISVEESFDRGVKLFDQGQPAEMFYFLLEGAVDLYLVPQGGDREAAEKGIPVGEITPGEPFSISGLIEPYLLTSSAWTSKPSRVIKIGAQALRGLFEKDPWMAYVLTQHAARAVMERLHATRTQLAAVLV